MKKILACLGGAVFVIAAVVVYRKWKRVKPAKDDDHSAAWAAVRAVENGRQKMKEAVH